MTAPDPGSSPAAARLPSLAGTADAEPWQWYARLRDAGGIAWDEQMGAWLVGSYELARRMGIDDDVVWHKPRVPSGGYVPYGWQLGEWVEFFGYGSRLTPSLLEGPEHDRIHRWWMRVFSGRSARELADTLIRPVADAEIDRFAGLGRAELCSDYAERVAPRVIASAMGLPWHDDAWMARMLALHRGRMGLIGRAIELDHAAPSDQTVAEARAAARGLVELVRPFVEERRDGTGDDLISLVWRDAIEVFGPGDRTEDVIAVVNVAFSGASGTIGAAATSCLYVLLSRPDLQRQARDGGDPVLGALVEETLRLYGPTVARPRVAKRDTELGGVRIAKGDLVILVAGAANRDDERFPDPDEIVLDRDAPRAHHTFHAGSRTCPGQGLARVQLVTILSALLERLDGLRLDPDAEPPRYRDHFRRRWRPLHARFTPCP